jgi:hypothetical protein
LEANETLLQAIGKLYQNGNTLFKGCPSTSEHKAYGAKTGENTVGHHENANPSVTEASVSLVIEIKPVE